jgi:hypothetical protein
LLVTNLQSFLQKGNKKIVFPENIPTFAVPKEKGGVKA